MSAAAGFRGQPLLVLAGLLGAWLALRIAAWQPADPALLVVPTLARVAEEAGQGVSAGAGRFFVTEASAPAVEPGPFGARQVMRALWRSRTAWIAPAAAGRADEAPVVRPAPVGMAVSHTLLLAAGLAQLELPPALAAYLQDVRPQQPGVPAAAPAAPSLAALPLHAPPSTGSRWSGDAWLMLRHDTTTAVASGRPSYGRSQAGAVMRYRLAPASAHGPQAYVRASSALAAPLDRDVVAGLSARPLARVPLRVALEARVSESAQGTELRPAAIAVTELPPFALPGGLRAEAYVQGGYVGGRFETAFVDGQGRVERTVARIGEAEVTAGAGAWGGAQKGAGRLDVGPTAAVSFRLGPRSSGARGRVAADYRLRVVGDAEPRSGPAVTLSAGF